jgi:hypothetical protein
MALSLKQSFETFSDFKVQIHQWAVADNFVIKIEKSDRSRCVVKCRSAADCPFHVRAAWKREEERVIITALNPTHTTCLGAAPASRASSSQFVYLREAVPKILTITKKTKPKEIQLAMQLHHNASIGYAVAHKVLQYLNGQDISMERAQFLVLSLYIQKLSEVDQAGHFHLSACSESRRFQRLFISPSASRHLFRGSPKFVAADGTFTKSKFRQILLFAVGIDGDNHVILLAWCLVESENQDSWEYFLHNLIRYCEFCLPFLDLSQQRLTKNMIC